MDQLYKRFLASAGVSIDTRSLRPGEIFFALSGEKFDGHDYVDKAIESGASYVVVEKENGSWAHHAIVVEDSVQALQELARVYRQSFKVPVIGLTGSNGKTTTKELLTAVLSQKYKVHATRGNLNNHLGVPLSILAADAESEILVIEMGANHIGEIEFLCGIAQPDYGLITNIGHAHIEGFGSYEGVIKAKTELYQHLDKNKGIIFYNASDEVLVSNLPATAHVVKYDNCLEFRFTELSVDMRITLQDDFISTNLYGAYNATNLQAAYTLGRYFEVEDSAILKALAEYEPKMNRSEIRKVGTTTFIMDAYNANPTSMENSIASFNNLKTDKKKVLILGDMKELGSQAAEYHQMILDQVLKHEWHYIILVGGIFSSVGGQHSRISCYDTTADLDEALQSSSIVLENCLCLLKASRSIGLEKIRMLTED